MDYKKILMGVISKTLNIAENGEIGKLLNSADGNSEVSEEQILEQILKKDVERIDGLKQSFDGSGKFQEGYAKAKKEVLSEFENNLKSKYKIESTSQGVDLIDDLISEKLNVVKEKSKMTDEDIKKHPVYQQMESKLLDLNKEIKSDYEKQIDKLNQEFKYKQTFDQVSKKAMDIFESMNPILPENKSVAQSQKQWFIQSLKDYEFSDADGKLVVLKDGKVVQDEHGNTRSFEDIVKNNAFRMFEFKKNNGGGNEGGGSDGAVDSTKSINFKSMSSTEAFKKFEQILNNPEITMEAKNEIAKQYNEAHG